jgi:hypothetical protein
MAFEHIMAYRTATDQSAADQIDLSTLTAHGNVNGCALDSNPCVRQYPAYGPIDIKQTDSNNHFNGWQTSLHRQFQSGWSLSANYMWSHAINDDSTGGGETDYPQINSCRACDTASSDADIRNVFSLNTI